jgi:hypothetical protein
VSLMRRLEHLKMSSSAFALRGDKLIKWSNQ